ncbi:hypothetical protein D4T97_018970 [Siminovitchia acidinfaciens]|uniref:Lipoprotein n=1 Tax=Siminovitchia acidinfaciens TaxID=2321395 RepID=A0A429XTT5_9BACI|nr:hypothetical protein [Siminovitchia acidinfaciens]RST71248.1 hypothetical protein D4T97_018970 [Siminovitchia acidinfaciens]
MKLKWKQIVPITSILLLAACTSVQEFAISENTSDTQKKIIKVNQNIEEHPAWNESPAEPVIGEDAVEVLPPTKKGDQ